MKCTIKTLTLFFVSMLFSLSCGNNNQTRTCSDSISSDSQLTESVSSDYGGSLEEDDSIPESMWTHSMFSGTMVGGGKTYRIELAISYPELGDVYCEVKGGYRYDGHSDMIALEGDWMEYDMGNEVELCLFSDEYKERFDLAFDGEDLISTSSLKGTWSKYGSDADYSMASNPQNTLKINLIEK